MYSLCVALWHAQFWVIDAVASCVLLGDWFSCQHCTRPVSEGRLVQFPTHGTCCMCLLPDRVFSDIVAKRQIEIRCTYVRVIDCACGALHEGFKQTRTQPLLLGSGHVQSPNLYVCVWASCCPQPQAMNIFFRWELLSIMV